MSNSKKSAGKIIGFTILGLFVFFVISGGCFFLGLVTSSIGALGGKPSAFSSTGNAIYEIRLEGTISASSTTGLLGGAAITPEYVIGQLIEAEKNANGKKSVNKPANNSLYGQTYDEFSAQKSGLFIDTGHKLLDYFLKK